MSITLYHFSFRYLFIGPHSFDPIHFNMVCAPLLSKKRILSKLLFSIFSASYNSIFMLLCNSINHSISYLFSQSCTSSQSKWISCFFGQMEKKENKRIELVFSHLKHCYNLEPMLFKMMVRT